MSYIPFNSPLVDFSYTSTIQATPEFDVGSEETITWPKYLVTAMVVGAVATGVFFVSATAGWALAVIAGWFVLSSIVCLLKAAAENTIMEDPMNKLHASINELNIYVMSFFLWPLSWPASYHEAKGNLDGKPILFVHGYASYGAAWHYMRYKFNNEYRTYTIDQGVGSSIAKYATEVAEKIQEIHRVTGKKVTLICHSRGGLVGTDAALKYAPGLVDKVVTIATPYLGAHIAFGIPGDDTQAMRPGSPDHIPRQRSISQAQGVDFLLIAAENDGVVEVASALGGKQNRQHQYIVKGLGHSAPLYSSQVFKRIDHFLKN